MSENFSEKISNLTLMSYFVVNYSLTSLPFIKPFHSLVSYFYFLVLNFHHVRMVMF